ncbi:MAG: hypothetical protein Q4F99_02090 [bacterium]|nr:hypothetical protein [bacterium]
MKKWMFFTMIALCATCAMAQKKSKGSAMKEGQVIAIEEISGVGGDSDYTVAAPQASPKFKKYINHTSDYSDDSVKGWHYFEVAYEVGSTGIDKDGAKKPILVIPEIEVTYALLYDMSKSKLASAVKGQAAKAKGAIGWENPKEMYSLFTTTITYTTITPKRSHYAAVCLPPSAVAVYGEPIAFSVQIKVDGVQQGNIETVFKGDAKVAGKSLKDIAYDKNGPCAWWERIENLTDAVVKRDGILRDRSATPFALAGDMYYDQVKMDK